MAGNLVSPESGNPSWFSPGKLLIVFCVVNLFTYVDRGAIASNGVNGSSGTCSESGICTGGSGIQGDFDLDNFEDGILSSAFMVGLLVSSPIFALLAKSINPFKLIGVGLSVWTIAVIGCGFSFDFWSITICRMLVGVGEASFASLAAPFIDDNAPVSQKTAWLAAFYMCIPTGYAIGYVYGGLVGTYLNWRYAFWGEAIVMLPFAILAFIVTPLQLKGFSPVEPKKPLPDIETVDTKETKGDGPNRKLSVSFRSATSSYQNHLSTFVKDTKVLLSEKVYVVSVLGACAYNFVLGAYSYWGPKAGKEIFNMTNADLIFGGITVVCGIVGTLGGGYALDVINSTIPNAFKLLSISTFIGGTFCFAAFCFKSLYAYLALFAVGELLVFATQAPVNFVNLHCVKPSLRPLSMAVATVSIHVFGDVPSSPLVGVLQDYLNNWRETALILTAILFPAAAIWTIGIFMHSVDRFYEDSEPTMLAIDGASRPLLDEQSAESNDSTL
ncbi:hypothetical protein MLD38_013432 [Melastoma candidum]|uniref:Uncharacterized protein n=1 Tax=Melastoma candidum TaxID=119954 RepID=A0ACB9RAP9_9MYRT|nr:hypothetical protein MLD38_013432 [Melastoma candidum]